MIFNPTKKHQADKTKEAIKLLNEVVKLQLRPSAVHGVGVFALRDIKKGETLYADIIPHQFDIPYSKFKQLDSTIRDIVLSHFPLIVEGSHFMYPVTKMSAFLNHSDKPNYDAKKDVALKAIKAGDEVLEDYRLIPSYEKVYPWLGTV